jgi:hypothetical protein
MLNKPDLFLKNEDFINKGFVVVNDQGVTQFLDTVDNPLQLSDEVNGDGNRIPLETPIKRAIIATLKANLSDYIDWNKWFVIEECFIEGVEKGVQNWHNDSNQTEPNNVFAVLMYLDDVIEGNGGHICFTNGQYEYEYVPKKGDLIFMNAVEHMKHKAVNMVKPIQRRLINFRVTTNSPDVHDYYGGSEDIAACAEPC